MLFTFALLDDGEGAGRALGIEDGGEVEDPEVLSAGVLDLGGDGHVGDGRDVDVASGDGHDESGRPLHGGGEGASDEGESSKREEHCVFEQVEELNDLRDGGVLAASLYTSERWLAGPREAEVPTFIAVRLWCEWCQGLCTHART